MSELIYILGNTGSGKSQGIGKTEKLKLEGLNPKETLLINVAQKRINCDNFKDFKNSLYVETKSFSVIKEKLNKAKEVQQIKNIVIDDFQYVWLKTFLDGIKNRVGLQLYTDLVYDIMSTLELCTSLRDEQLVFITSHIEEYNDSDGYNKKRMMAVGDSTHRRGKPEGLSSIVLYAEGRLSNDKVSKHFRTQGDGVKDTCKSPFDMFDFEIPNDLGFVEKRVREFWELSK